MLRTIVTALLLGVLALAPHHAFATEDSPSGRLFAGRIGDRVLERTTLAPMAFIKFCRTSPADCESASPDEDVPSRNIGKLLREVNRAVNRRIEARSDEVEEWQASPAAGDCEDYVLTKRRELIAAGVPASTLRIAVAVTDFGEGHAVLVVRHDGADLVLDNRTDEIRTWNRTDLRFLKIASLGNPKVWFAVN